MLPLDHSNQLYAHTSSSNEEDDDELQIQFHLQQSRFYPANRTGLAGSTESICSFLVPQALVFSTPPSSPLEPHPYLTTLDDLPPRNSNPPPPPPSLSQGHS
ncbi:hypothetical protein Tco_0812276 [Tanacetum coccineum]